MAPSILLIDDDANFRRTLRIALALESLQVIEAGNIDEGRKVIDGGPFDCVVVNLLTGGGDPRRLLQKIRMRYPSVGRIACSAYPEVLGAFSLEDPEALTLEKPFTVDTLLAAVAHWVHPGRLFRHMESGAELRRAAADRLRNGR